MFLVTEKKLQVQILLNDLSFPYKKHKLHWIQVYMTKIQASTHTERLIYLQNLIASPKPAISGCCPFFINFMDHYGILREQWGGVNPLSQTPRKLAAMTHPSTVKRHSTPCQDKQDCNTDLYIFLIFWDKKITAIIKIQIATKKVKMILFTTSG